MNILPDSRLRNPIKSIRSPIGNLIPIYCAHCGKEWGMVPEEHITFAFALCDPCAETMGPIAHTYCEPDVVFWSRVQEAKENKELPSTIEGIEKALQDPSSCASILARDWERHIR